MWFGNLVSYSYWNELYLTEGWATLFSSIITNSLFPQWKVLVNAETAKNGFKLSDSLQSSPPLIHSIKSFADINGIFNVISYTKGGAFYDMLNHRMGSNIFQEMLRYHYKKFSFKATVTNDLLNSFQKYFPEFSIPKLRTWTDQAGYPLITVNDRRSGFYSFSQKRFYSEEVSKPDNSTWWVPIRYTTSSGEILNFSFSEKESPMLKIQGSWFKLNKNQNGVFRVNYPETIWRNLIKAIESQDKNLSELDILGLTDDIFVLSGSSEVSVVFALDLSKSCNRITYHGVLNTLITSLREISNRLTNKPIEIQKKYQRFVSSIFDYNIRRLGWEKKPEDSHDDSKNRELILIESSYYENEEVIRECMKRYTSGNIPKEFERLIFDTVVKSSDRRIFNVFLEKFKNARNEDEKMNYLLALTQTKDLNLMKVVLDILVSDAVRSQDGMTYFGYIVRNNQQSSNVVWEYVKQNYPKILEKFGQTLIDTRLVSFVTFQFDTTNQYNDVKEFFKTRSSSPYVSLALSNILRRKKYIDTIYSDLVNYFQ
jgi:puromycin-sensitive aminopeptidase